ncbi:hypothetical protein TC41_0777 [Alicyclobacillus acidocaldarius subsp. acidocaldarius Tc-4-1]|uniref:Uncharacterized protein n=1 Tax=Alicyclobacillus acidocaldarius (strain Tc-4-1) TaxID=1048834 RepID=F8IEM1_ALIAT|nr:hypothetical protein TC41_0777 [Alicyclobacillus acidocaldarius subsp. acidocaldarius Tc-4-1]
MMRSNEGGGGVSKPERKGDVRRRHFPISPWTSAFSVI